MKKKKERKEKKKGGKKSEKLVDPFPSANRSLIYLSDKFRGKLEQSLEPKFPIGS